MRTKSIPARSRNKSLDPSPSLPGRFGTCDDDDDDERDAPQKKRHCRGGTSEEAGDKERSSETLNLDASCIVCDVSDDSVSRCCGKDCPVRFHEKCLTPEFGGNEDLNNPFCPYCWFIIVALKSKSLEEKAIEAEKAFFMFLDKEMDEVNQEHSVDRRDIAKADKDSHRPEKDKGKLEDEERVATGNFRDDEDETAQVQTKEQELVQVNDEKQRRRRRRVQLNDTDSEISSSKEGNGDHVTEQREATAATKVAAAAAKSKTARAVSFFNKDHRRRVLWTPEEEEMLKVGVEMFAAEANKKMPWKKILEIGRDVFQKTRSPSDLKDKWRNMANA